MQAIVPELVNAVGSTAKYTFSVTADVIEQSFSSGSAPATDETRPLRRQTSSGSGSIERQSSNDDDGDPSSGFTWTDNFGASGRVTMIAESVPLVGQLVATAQLLTGHVHEAKRALAKSTKSTVMGGVAASAAVAGGAMLGAYGGAIGLGTAALSAVGWMGGAAVGSAAGELTGGASQALVEATVYDDTDRRKLGTEYLSRTPAQWGAGLAVASTAGVVGASVGLNVDSNMLMGRIEQKVASELTETVATRASLAIAPGLRRISSKRRRELASLDHVSYVSDDDGEDADGVPPMPRRMRSQGYGTVGQSVGDELATTSSTRGIAQILSHMYQRAAT
mmetsp:Transcript_35251/g.92503  ORF Transcript_35251/g.92503 Transcript_35251/m.92503 type:complete len:336 (-) Transcript_35251:565-1572(-)